jgi:hypothetical protein
VKPVFIERIQTEFLLCYSDYSFFVNRNGWRARSDWMITWEGTPNAFAIFTPYILAFEPSFIEIRHMDTGMLVNIITAKNIRMLHSSTREVCVVVVWTIIMAANFASRSCTRTRTKWEKMWSRAWTSGASRMPSLVASVQLTTQTRRHSYPLLISMAAELSLALA